MTLLNIQPTLVDVIKNKTANAISWRFDGVYTLGSDAAPKTVSVDFYEKTQTTAKIVFTTRVTIPTAVLQVWEADSVITNEIVRQIPEIVLVP